MTEFRHQPVLLRELLDLIGTRPVQSLVDCTVGGAGHASALLDALPRARLFAFDRDLDAVAAARERLSSFGSRAVVEHGAMSSVADRLAEQGIGPVDFVFADLGVSSYQLDTPERGFSFRSDAPLDMRMDPSTGMTAAELIASSRERELADIIFQLGEERRSRAVAAALVREQPQTTGEAARIIRQIVPRSRDGIDPATRTFQALRMKVNDELGQLEVLLAALPAMLAPGGLAAVMSFHSLEDRAVKQAFREHSRGCICPPEIPVCLCAHRATLKVLTRKPICASADEVETNPRSRSTKLRAAERLAAEGR